MISGLEVNHLAQVQVQLRGRICFKYFIRLLSINSCMYDGSLRCKLNVNCPGFCQKKSFDTSIDVWVGPTTKATPWSYLLILSGTSSSLP